jgi:soluble calcium-activated nucleotidase 1
MCDFTGLVYKIDHSGKVFQRWALADGDGKRPKPFKGEWATIKDGRMLVGSIGMEWLDADGRTVKHHDAEWVKFVDANGGVRNVNWAEQFNVLRRHTNTTFPGYLIHEAVEWDAARREWIFLPRRVSRRTPFDPISDRQMGGNVMLLVDEQFQRVRSVVVGEHQPMWGFTSVKVIPGTDDLMALKVMESDSAMHSVLMVFDRHGALKMPVTSVSDVIKYEGLAFIDWKFS